jgi:hypothetical protein
LLGRVGRQDDQPFEPDAPGHCLDRIKAPGQIQIGHDSAGGLGLSHSLERQRSLAAGPFAVDGCGCGTGQPAQSQDRVEGSKAGWYRPI